MATGYMKGGTEKLVCKTAAIPSAACAAEPLSPTGLSSDFDVGKLNCIFYGNINNWATGSRLVSNLGLADYSYEGWIKRTHPTGDTGVGLYPPTPGAFGGLIEAHSFFGFSFAPSTDDASSLVWWPTNPSLTCYFHITTGVGGPYTIGPIVTPTDWFHVAVNCDRDGDMEFFLNGVSQGTVDISAEAAINRGAAISFFNPYNSWNAAVDANSEWSTMAVSDNAAHTRLLTPQEIQSSYYSRTVNSLGADSLFCFRFVQNIYPGGDSSDPDGVTLHSSQFWHLDCTPGFLAGGPITSIAWANLIYNNTLAVGAVMPDKNLLSCGVNAIITDASGGGNHCYYGSCATSPGYWRDGVSPPGDWYSPTIFYHDPDR